MAKKTSNKLSEQMEFDSPSRPHNDVERDLAGGRTPHHRVPYQEDPESQKKLIDKLASQGYSQHLDRYGEYHQGDRNVGRGLEGGYVQNYGRVFQLFMTRIAPKENRNKVALEEAAKNIVMDEFNISEEDLQFDLKLKFEPISTQTPQKMTKQARQEKMAELDAEGDEGMTLERAKRRILNAMTQGLSVDGTDLFKKAEFTLRQLGMADLIPAYGDFASTMLMGYWQAPNAVIDAANGDDGDENEAAAGKTYLDKETNPPTVRAEALSFPYLIHEACKGVMEFLSLTSNPEDPERYQTAMNVEDQVSEETWDIRIGTPIWRMFLSLLPEAYVTDDDKKHLKFYVYSNLSNLTPKEFMSFIDVMVKDDEESRATAKRILGAMAYDLERTLDGEDITGEEHFRNEIDSITKGGRFDHPDEEGENPDDDDDLNDMLAGLGITRR